MSKDFTDTEAFIRFIFLKRIKDDLEHPRADAIHVSSLVYGCPRKVFFDWKLTNYKSVYSSYDEKSLANFWIGTKMHEVPITNVIIKENGMIEVFDDINEYDIKENFVNVGEWQLRRLEAYRNGKFVGVLGYEVPVWDEELNITGSLDELVYTPDGELVLVDKKSTSNMPNRPYEHHQLQVAIYADLLERNYGIKANKGAILYMRKSSGSSDWDLMFRPYEFNIDNKLRSKVRELFKIADEVLKANERGEIPRARPSWLCSKCPYYQICIDLGFKERKFEIEEVKKRDLITAWISR